MANIIELLQNILSAQYGKDVRQSIHDAIQTCYEDGRAGAIDMVARAEIADCVKTEDVIDSLTSTDTDKPLSANQGKVLNESKQVKLISRTITVNSDEHGWVAHSELGLTSNQIILHTYCGNGYFLFPRIIDGQLGYELTLYERSGGTFKAARNYQVSANVIIAEI